MSLLKMQIPSDFIGASASALCLVHCIATPFLFVAQSAISGWWAALDYGFIVITFLAVFFSARQTSRKWMQFALYGGWVVLSILIINEKMTFILLGEAWKYGAAFGLISLHLYNRKLSRCNDVGCAAH